MLRLIIATLSLAVCLMVCSQGFAGYGELEHMESETLYRVKIGSKHPECFIAVRYVPAPHHYVKDFQAIEAFYLIAADRHHILQRIDLKHMAGEYDGHSIEIGDFNWDGWLDFRIHDLTDGKGWRQHLHYVFDPDTMRYKKCKVLDDLGGPWFDDEEHTINSVGSSGGELYSVETYRWKGEKLYETSFVVHSRDEKRQYFSEYGDRLSDGTWRRRRFYLEEQK